VLHSPRRAGPAATRLARLPRRHGLFIVKKNRRQAKCLICSHQLGWELRPVIGSQLEIVQTQVCRSQEDVLTTGEQWKAGMLENGWR
jgi:hypothetical protein